MRRALKRALEGYRWLWQAQRRWRPGALWLACIQFVSRVMADLMRSVIPRGPTAVAAIAGMVVAVVLGLTVVLRDRSPDVQPAAWRHEPGGFGVAFPAPWESASDDDVVSVAPFGEPLPGSAYRRDVGSLLFPRFITAQTYTLGEIFSVDDAPRSLTERVVGPVESLVRAETASPGVRVAAYRFEHGGEPLTQAAIVFRGTNAGGFAIGLTGRREDEAIVLAEARQIADSIRHDEEPLMDGEIALATLLEIPLETLLAARAMGQIPGERRDSALVTLLPVAVPDAATLEECRAAAIQHLYRAPPRIQVTSAWKGFETQITCRSSVITIRANFRTFVPLLRQFDSSGARIYEATIDTGITGTAPQHLWSRTRSSFWVVNGERYDLARDPTRYGSPIVRVRIGS